jgi:2-dehydro-3-deoxyphosphooctonate aldolase (KDO 8-P synthase)
MDLYNSLRSEERFFIVAGPCVVEDLQTMRSIAGFLKEETARRNVTLIFKASYAKANRTSGVSYSGPGLDEGLSILQTIRTEFDLPILTDVHETTQVKAVAEVADILQVPAFLSRQTFLITEAATTGRIINIKKGQFMAPEDMHPAAEKILAENNFQVLLTERGTSFGYHNLVVDFRSFPVLHSIGYPVIFDATHSLQMPSVTRTTTGNPQYIPMMAKAALSTGYVNGLYVETHPHPMEAMADGSSLMGLADIPELLDNCLNLYK